MSSSPPHQCDGPTSSMRTCTVLTTLEDNTIDLSKFEIDETHLKLPPGDPSSKDPKMNQKRIIDEEFLSGPIRMSWIAKASALKGACLAVALCLRHLKNMRKSDTIKLGNKFAATLGIKPDAKDRALRKLEQSGLISVHRKTGNSPLITLIGDD